MSKQKKYHYIYKTTCLITGKFYIGMHSTDSLEDNYLGSGKILGYSRRKYGDENHVREILHFCSSRQELKMKEAEIVNEDLLKNPLNINLKYGGEGGWDHIPSNHFSHAKAGRIGGINVWKNEENVKKLSALSSIRMSELHRLGKIKYNTFDGKQHTPESRIKMSVSHQGKQLGSKNSQYGVKRIGINKDGKIKKILPEELQRYTNEGWSKGFKQAQVAIKSEKKSKRRWVVLTCLTCSKEFDASQRDVRRNRKFCSLKCCRKLMAT